MTVRVAISGFGRIGRLALRAIAESDRTDVEVVAINNRAPIETAMHLFRFDSAHGRYRGEVSVGEDSVDLGFGPIVYTRFTDPRECRWADLDVDVVMECTGKFTARADAALHLEAGAKRVLVSAPAKGADATIVFGVNDATLTGAEEIVSAASCTTNCLAPVAKVLHEAIGIEQGFMTTIHAFTGDQPTLDATHSDLYRGRSAATSMIPTNTGAAAAVGLALPELDGKLDGVAMRVPTQNVSAVDLKFTAERVTSPEEINALIRSAAGGALKGVLDFTDEKLVSVDFNHDPHSAVFHTDQTRVMNDRFCRVLAWYDNEWGFAHRMADVAATMGARMAKGDSASALAA